MTREWSIQLRQPFNRRFEDDSLVLWRPGMTAWIIVWSNNLLQTATTRLARIRRDMSQGAFDLDEFTHRDVIYFAYRLEEPSDDARVAAFCSFAVGTTGHVQMSVYFDDEADLPRARDLWRSLREDPGDGERPA